MRRETQNVLLVLFGGALLKISLDGTYLRYVKPAQQPWLIVAGAVLVALAAVSIGRDVVTGFREARTDPHAGHTTAAPRGCCSCRCWPYSWSHRPRSARTR